MNAAQILVVDDEADIRTLIKEILSEEGYAVETAGDATEARAQMAAGSPDLVLLDIWMPDTDGITLLTEWSGREETQCPVVIMSGHGTVETAVEATRLGAVDYVEKPLSLAKLLRTVENALEKRPDMGRPVKRGLMPSIETPLGKSPTIADLREQARQFAARSAPVLITGEGGTGREGFARYMHALGDRSTEEFVVLTAATITAENMSELLMGTDGGEPGYLERANGGTLYVTDLQDLVPDAQRLLKGLLDQGSFTRLGRAEPVPFDIRLFASCRPGLDAAAESGEYRSDLLAKFSVLTLVVPPLREYPEDVSELLRYFVDAIVDTDDLTFRRFSVAAQNRLRNYPWPGNIAELRRLVERLLSSGGAEEISLAEVERELSPATGASQPLVEQDLLSMPLREAREHFERAYLTQQLALCGGKVGKLAKRVGMERTHLYRKLRALGIDFRQVADR